MNPNNNFPIEISKLRMILERNIGDLQQILNQICNKDRLQSVNIKEEILSQIPYSPANIKIAKICNNLKKKGLINGIKDIKQVLNELLNDNYFNAKQNTLGKKNNDVTNNTIVFLGKDKHSKDKMKVDQNSLINNATDAVPSFYNFVRNLEKYIFTQFDYGRRIPIINILSYCKKRDNTLSESLSLQFLKDLNLLFPKNVRFDPAGENMDLKDTIRISGILYSHIILIGSLIS